MQCKKTSYYLPVNMHHVPEDLNRKKHWCENGKPRILKTTLQLNS